MGREKVSTRKFLGKGNRMVYQITIKGNIDKSWFDWLGQVEIFSELQSDGSVITTLMVDTEDQSTLFGILDRIRDLNIPLITVTSGQSMSKEI